MYCYRKVRDDIYWVGGNDRRLAMFEGIYSVPDGVSYNSYLVLDDKTVLFDTVDRAVSEVFFDNLNALLGTRALDYLVVQHMEPDHSATIARVLEKHPETKVVCSRMALGMIKQFFDTDITARTEIVAEGSTLSSGKHEFVFVTAPMVHWPEVIVTYDKTDKILFSADAFGTFGALNGALFADEVDFYNDYTSEARRYYTNIVGKYGQQVQALLKKASGLDIQMICPLHGFVHRSDLGKFIELYDKWSSYTPEVNGVMIAYASVYGNTANAADILACELRERGIKTTVFDVSVTPASDIVSEAFRYSHLVFASTTYNTGIFIAMEDLLRDIAQHNLSNRTIAIIENGSWSPSSGKQMKAILEPLPGMRFIENTVTIKSALNTVTRAGIAEIADELAKSVKAQ